MTYWLFDGSDVVGPFTVQQLLERGGFGPGSLVCPEAHASDETYWKAASGYADFGFGAAQTGKPLCADDLTLPEDAPDESFEQEMLDTLIGANCPLASPDEIEPAPAEPVTLRMPTKHPTRPSPIEDYFNNIKGEDLGNILGIPDPNENSDMNLQRALEHQFADTTPPVEKEIHPIENDPFDEFTSPDLEEDPDAVLVSDKTPSAVLESVHEPAPPAAAASAELEKAAREKSRRQDELTAAFASETKKDETPQMRAAASPQPETAQSNSGENTRQPVAKMTGEPPVTASAETKKENIISKPGNSRQEKITPPESKERSQTALAEKTQSVQTPEAQKQTAENPAVTEAKTTPSGDEKPKESAGKQPVKKPVKTAVFQTAAQQPANQTAAAKTVQAAKKTGASKADVPIHLSQAEENLVIVPSEEQLTADMPDAEEVSTLRIQLPESAAQVPVKDVKAEKAEAARLQAADEQAASEAQAVFAASEREAAARAESEAAVLNDASATAAAVQPDQTPAPATAKAVSRSGVQMPSLPEDGALQAAESVSAPEPEAEELVAQDDQTDPAAQTVKDILQGQLKVEEQPEVKEPIKEVPVAVEPEETRVKPRLNQTPEIEEFLTERVVRRSRKKPAGVLALLIAMLVAGGAFYLNRSLPQETAPASPSKPRPAAQASAVKTDAARMPALPATATVVPPSLPDIPLPPVTKISAADRARAIAQEYYLPEHRSTIGEYFDRIYKDKKAEGYTAAWSVDPLHKDVYIVKYRVTKTRKEPIMYIFQVDTGKDKLVGALNNVTLDLVGKIK